MATTDARPGFRLPWTPDQRPDGDADGPSDEVAPSADASTEAAAESMPAAPADVPAAPRANRRPNKFLADLGRAMQAAAEAAREETIGRLQTDAKAHIEEIHARSASEAADLRRQADDDVAGIREWSKAEIARIREETERRITDRKGRLEGEIEAHTARIERRAEQVQSRVAAFEAEMATFFERLLAEDDPTRLAAMAENLPEPPPFDADADDDIDPPVVSTAALEEAVDDTAAMAAIEAAAESAEATTPGGVAAGVPDEDPRLSALGLDASFAAAEAEALADARTDDDVEIPVIGDDALAARIAGLVPPADDADAAAPKPATSVVVTGLVSVASIASFKRHLARVPGVSSVGVSSGPEGEFVFAVAHSAEANLREVIPTLTGFGALVTGGADGTIEVAARDPESEA